MIERDRLTTCFRPLSLTETSVPRFDERGGDRPHTLGAERQTPCRDIEGKKAQACRLTKFQPKVNHNSIKLNGLRTLVLVGLF